MPSAPESKQILLLDIKAEMRGDHPAQRLEQALLHALRDFSPSLAEAARPYWKIPAWHECTVKVAPASRASFDALVGLVEAAWHLILADEADGDCEAIWNPAPGQQFLLPEVRWANLILLTLNSPNDRPASS